MVKRAFKSLVSYVKSADLLLWILLLAITAYSLILLRSVSRATNSNYFQIQLVAAGLGIAAAVVISLIDYAEIGNFWYLVAGFSVFLMIYTLLFGIEVTGGGGVAAKAWISIGGRTFQSSELVKIAFLVTYGKHLEYLNKADRIKEPLQVVLLACHALVPMALCELQKDTGAAVVFFVMFLFMSFAAGVQFRYFAALAVVVLVMFPILWRFFMAEYQKDRLIALFNLENAQVRLNEGYQQYQGMISIGSGRLNGQGLYEGARVTSGVVPFQHSDYIFTVAGEELGFVGCSLILGLLLLFMLKVLHVAASSRDGLGKYICFGFFGLVAFQSLYNIGMCLALLPVMGITLPFFSAGGSSAICLYLGFGLVQSVYMRRKESDGLRLNRTKPMRFSYRQMQELTGAQPGKE